MPTAAEKKEFEEAIAASQQHTNLQTFSSSSDTLISETIDTPGVTVKGRIACLITAVAVLPDFGLAHATNFLEWRTQIMGGTQTSLRMPDDAKYIAEMRLYSAYATGVGLQPFIKLPLVFSNPTKPMLIVNPKMTIMHVTTEMVDAALDDVYTMFSYQNVELTIEMHTALLHAQSDLT